MLGFQHFETFDGMRYEFHGPPCNYVLVEVGQIEFYGPPCNYALVAVAQIELYRPLYSTTYNSKYANLPNEFHAHYC